MCIAGDFGSCLQKTWQYIEVTFRGSAQKYKAEKDQRSDGLRRAILHTTSTIVQCMACRIIKHCIIDVYMLFTVAHIQRTSSL